MYKMVIRITGEQQRVAVFRGPHCRKKMLELYYDYRDKAAEREEIKSIRVWGTIDNKATMILEWVSGAGARRITR